MPEEEVLKSQQQAAAGEEGPGPYRGFDPFMHYLLHRLDTMESSLNARIDRVEANLRQEMSARIDGLRQEMTARIDGSHQELAARIDGLHQELHSTTRWIIGTVIAAAGVAVALVQPLK